jgi:hypothetical protein
MKKLIVLSIFFTLFQSCSFKDVDPEPIRPAIGELSTGSFTSFGSINLGPGVAKMIGSTGAGLRLEGFTISQELSSNSSLSISAAPINNHSFGKLITPISPLISIHVNSEANASETLYKVTIPVSEEVKDDEFMMAFYYDATSGKLEGIPTVAYEKNKLTIATTHFSDFFLTKVKLALLPDKIYTGFKPEVDGWPYTNYGTCYNPGGICAGMSLTAMYVYANHGGNLYTKADNDLYQEAPSPEFGVDDVNGIIFGNYGQTIYSNFLNVWRSNVWLLGLDDAITYRCFAYSMSVTAEPQYVRLGGSTFDGGHAMVAYAIDESQIFVYDPNYPARRDRIVNFRGKTSATFDPYQSGDDAAAIADGNGRSYDLITYASKSALISTQELESGYAGYAAKNLQKEFYSVDNLELVLLNSKNEVKAKSKLPIMISSEKEVKLAYLDGLNVPNLVSGAAYYNDKLERITKVTLDENKETIIGVHVVGKYNNHPDWDWLGFKWFFVKYSKLDPNLFGKWSNPNADAFWQFNADGTLVQNANGKDYNWNWVIENGKIKMFVPYGNPAYITYKIENGVLYIWVDSLSIWSAPMYKS